MSTAYILINYDIEKKKNEQDAVNRLKNVPGVVEVNLVNGVYDIVVKITSDALDSLKETITRDIRTIDIIRSTMTLILIE
jgi:DNA-binding Lrp family transcriptional regulator